MYVILHTYMKKINKAESTELTRPNSAKFAANSTESTELTQPNSAKFAANSTESTELGA